MSTEENSNQSLLIVVMLAILIVASVSLNALLYKGFNQSRVQLKQVEEQSKNLVWLSLPNGSVKGTTAIRQQWDSMINDIRAYADQKPELKAALGL
ncbi:MAG: hypothetical protein SGI71_11520 [Verrucomicrobiota bacterium]|nr:hypothetical protein [Verrucomicrobiota bacterium]